jgi:polyhydroxyalkanoate synthesis regulator phasin
VAGEEQDDKRSASRADQVRAAAAQALEATAGQAGISRERAQGLADELASAAGRIRGALDEIRPATADEVRALRAELRALEARVARLETAAPARTRPRRRAPRPPA